MSDPEPNAGTMSFLISAIARFTKQEESAIDPEGAIVEMGLQSIDAVILSGEVEDHFGIELDPATVFEHETLLSFAQEITRRQAQA